MSAKRKNTKDEVEDPSSENSRSVIDYAPSWEIADEDFAAINPEITEEMEEKIIAGTIDDPRFLTIASAEFLAVQEFNAKLTAEQQEQSILARHIVHRRLLVPDVKDAIRAIGHKQLKNKRWTFIQCCESNHYYLAVIDSKFKKIFVLDSIKSKSRFLKVVDLVNLLVKYVYGVQFDGVQVEVSFIMLCSIKELL